ncbi:hypothetical protein [Allostreptomyces psammosilenae]|uniref:Uncharacterized protein n=1 Tax=Allostreptomyces psammosilenae TaxID=1892865 RepID=A0A852ZQD9_9ACTN|nr:hypothetical protein [Allostreptomyces psammosilenae]NYI03707.1 hypothetical protein [Allostreptomyces psammosilenae]
MGIRRRLSEPARQAGLGELRRVHRQRRSWGTRALGMLLVGTALATGWLYFSVGNWWLAVLLPPLVLAGYAGWVYGSAIGSPGGRLWYAVCDEGLLVWSERLGGLASIPWDAVIGVAPAGMNDDGLVYDLSVVDSEGQRRTVPIGLVTARRDLLRAINGGRPAPTPIARRAVGAGVGALVLGVVAWLVVLPELVPTTVDERPAELSDFARACERGGARYPQAAPYGEAGPHPLVLFHVENRRVDGYGPDFSADGGDATEEESEEVPADAVQLVACSHNVGRVDDSYVERCVYSGGVSVEYYQGRYRVDVYEARTHRLVGTVEVLGDDSVTCSDMVYATEGEDREEDTLPSDYGSELAPFVDGEAAGGAETGETDRG